MTQPCRSAPLKPSERRLVLVSQRVWVSDSGRTTVGSLLIVTVGVQSGDVAVRITRPLSCFRCPDRRVADGCRGDSPA